jgi:RimJ/RimL family protein N-acetyltransferase
LKKIIKNLLNIVFSEYEIFKIFCFRKQKNLVQADESKFKYIELSEADFKHYDSGLLKKNKSYIGKEALGFACLYQGDVVGVCFFWFGNRYLQRNFIPLKDNEVKLVQIETLENMRGKGVAPNLIAYSCQQIFNKGFETLYARIWHSNTPSIKSFTKANWQYSHTIFVVKFRFGYIFKFNWPR